MGVRERTIMRALLSTYLRSCGIVPADSPAGLTFADAASGIPLSFTLSTDGADRAGTRQLVAVHAAYLFDGGAYAENEGPASAPDTNETVESGTSSSSGATDAYLWPAPWSMARRREATMLINAINATLLRVGALSLPPMDPISATHATGPGAVRFTWVVPIGSQRDLDLIDTALQAARDAFATLLPALAHVVIDGYPASIALGGAPVPVRKANASRRTG